MNILRPLALGISAIATAVAFSACGNTYDTDYHGQSVQMETSHNFLGIIKTAPGSYIPGDSAVSVVLNADELCARRDVSGNHVSLFWGAITFTDL